MLPNVALVGKARAGKDSVAARLCETWGYQRVAFADPLKESALRADPWITYDSGGEDWLSGISAMRLSEVVTRIGWEQAKVDFPEVRRFLQEFGQGVRSMDEDFWLRAAQAKIAAASGPVVITDCRYPNEFLALARSGFTMVRVTRPASGLAGSAADHDSETALDSHRQDYDLWNGGSLNDLADAVDSMVCPA